MFCIILNCTDFCVSHSHVVLYIFLELVYQRSSYFFLFNTRKANKIVQYKRVFINDEDEEEEQLTESRSSDKPVENGSTEGGDAVVPESLGDEEPESFSDPSELVQSGLQESVLYENSLATFEKIAGVSLDQVVSSHRQENNGDNKNRLEAAAGSVEKLGMFLATSYHG